MKYTDYFKTKNGELYLKVFIVGIIILVLLSLVQIFDIAYPVNVRTQTVSGELAVIGEGKVDVVPDTATVQVGIVVANAKTVQAAEQQMADINNKIISSVQALGVDKKDIQTTNYSINPNYNYDNGQNNITSYYGSATVSIKVKDTANLAKVIQASTNAGANQIYDTTYSIDNPEKYREQARNEAIANARAQAKELASTLGIKLGKVVNIVESSNGGPIVFNKGYDTAQMGLGGGAGVAPNLQPGTQTVSSTVTLYFQKK